MRIAVVNDTVHPFFKGGAQKRVYEISRRLVQRGHEVHWYCMDYGVQELEGIQMHPVSPSYDLYTTEGKRRIWQAIRFAAKLSIREKVDVIDCMNFPYLHCFMARESARRLGVPLVITWFEFWGDYWYEYMGRRGWISKQIEKMVTRLPQLIIADSGKVQSQLQGVGVPEQKIRVVPDGVDNALTAGVKPSRDEYDVVYVGRMLAHKNVEVLIHALAGLDGVTAAIIGQGESLARCVRLSEELGIDDRVKFLGHVASDEDVYATIKSSKVLVLPSTQEGHPLVIPEAYACGVPVIAIEGVCDEFVRDGVTGYLSLLDVPCMIRQIENALLKYPTFKEVCLQEAEKYDWEKITDMVESVYREVVR
ncbi:MAG: glycosyltransferase family 4 protein [Candidatus Bathyanammoxibius sp.]